MKLFIATGYFEALPNALGQARWDDTQVNYWKRADGRALSFFQHWDAVGFAVLLGRDAGNAGVPF